MSNPVCSDEVRTQILECFRNDDIANIWRTDKDIALLGAKLWLRITKRERKVVMNNMRPLGKIVHKTRLRTTNPTFSGEDIIKRQNWEELSKSHK